MPVLACPVRGCALPLQRAARVWTCASGHAFDIARSGYVNLLQPQDRRSLDAGDSREAIEARMALLAAGIGREIVDAFVRRAAALLELPAGLPRRSSEGAKAGVSRRSPERANAGSPRRSSEGAKAGLPRRSSEGANDGLPRRSSAGAKAGPVVDLGCGAGDALGLLHDAAAVPLDGVGIDLSTVAIDRAARRFPALTWVVANADRRLPLRDGSVSLLLSLHARRNPAEARRVLAPGGHLLVAVPAADDLVELREAVQGSRVERDRVADVLDEHRDGFEPVARETARERHRLEAPHLQALLRGTYRGGRAREAARVTSLDHLEVTLASEFIVFSAVSAGDDGRDGDID